MGLALIIFTSTATQTGNVDIDSEEPAYVTVMLSLHAAFHPLHDTDASLSNPSFKRIIKEKPCRSHTLASFSLVSNVFH